jgi:hypothetical protein
MMASRPLLFATKRAPGGASFLFRKSIDEILSNFHMGRHGAQICALAKPKMRTTRIL